MSQSQSRERGEEIRSFILQNVEQHPDNIAHVAANKFKISRQAINKHLKKLVEEEALGVQGNTRNRRYQLLEYDELEWDGKFNISPELAEDVVWDDEIRHRLGEMSASAMAIWNHGFTEMFNNAIDHSEGTVIEIHIARSATTTEISLDDDGIGIFKKIQKHLKLPNEYEAALELAKGKFTTAPNKHSGEGIFFTSRMFDSFEILSGGINFTHECDDPDQWFLNEDKVFPGTTIRMKLNNDTSRSIKTIFDEFSSGDDYSFNKTIVPVTLAQYGGQLVSRSQAKRLLVRFDRFETIILDFKDVDSVGQAFADEVFRVFQKQHPDIELTFTNTNENVERMIKRATSHA
jgi:anti-sigma regulatory factor (Ser/Thr protein kinase)/uncharacterized protein (DUF1330 family)